MTLKNAALAYAERGWPVFPLEPWQQVPLEGSNGFKDASTDPDQIEAWWDAMPNANIGFVPGDVGLAVIDLDPGAEPEKLDLPETSLVADTPRGRHLFYELEAGEIVPPSASKLAPHVDVRSASSYVVLAPSLRADGVYKWVNEGRPAFRPDILLETTARERHENAQVWIIDPDMPEHVAKAISWLQTDAKIAVEGEGGDATAYATAAYLRSLGISKETALPLMLQHWNSRCNPPWGEHEVDHLEDKVCHAYNYATSPPGNLTRAYKKAANRQLFKAVRKATAIEGEANAYTYDRFTLHTRAGINDIPEPQWIVKGLLYEDAYAIMYAPEEHYKTFIALDIALSVATGGKADRPAHFGSEDITEAHPVLYMTGEGLGGIKRRVAAWEKVHNGGKEIGNFWLLNPTPRLLQDSPDQLADFLASAAPFKLIVIDTISRVMQGLNDGEQQHATAFTGLVDELRKVAPGCSVLALHHVLKDGKTIRGSRAFSADADITLPVEDKSGLSVSMRVEKMKDGEPRPPMRWGLQKASIEDKTTLVTVPPAEEQAQTAPKTEKHKEQFRKAAEDRSKRADWSHADQLIVAKALEVLDSVAGKSWTTNALAEVVAYRLEDISKSSARDHINHHKVEHGSPLHGRYDPIAARFK